MKRARRPTLNLQIPAKLQSKMFAAADAAGVSPSRWATDVLERELGGETPQLIDTVAGDSPEKVGGKSPAVDGDSHDLPGCKEPISEAERAFWKAITS